jgi:2-keto-3-deoxy-L-rhamnonate aldolase RhmA
MTTGTLTGLRARIRELRPLTGAMLTVPDVSVATILGRAGFDFVVIDAEHAPFTVDSLGACIVALEPTPAHIIVRVAANDVTYIKQALELGADGVQVPNVSSGEETAAAVRAARYSPEGARGVGIARSTGFGMDISRVVAEANAGIAVLVMIEDGRGVANAAEIAATPGLDGIVVGPYDLSGDLGVIGQPTHPTVVQALDDVVRAANEAGTAMGTLCAPGDVGRVAAAGMHILTTFTDVIALASAAAASHQEAGASLRG